MIAYQRVLDAFKSAGLFVDERDGKASAQAPGHSSADRSVTVTAIEGAVLVHSHSDPTDDVLDALNLSKGDLFDEPKGSTYRYPDDRLVYRTPTKQFRQSGNTKGSALFHSDRLKEDDSSTVHVVEGEKDVHAVEAAGGVAVCPAMGAGKAHLADWAPLHGRRVVIVADDDKPGLAHARQVYELLDGMCESLTVVKAATGKDAADHVAAGCSLTEFELIGNVPAIWVGNVPESSNRRSDGFGSDDRSQIVPEGSERSRNVPGTFRMPSYTDVAALLDGTLPEPPAPQVGERSDGVGLFYRGQYNNLFGDPECGKTLLASVAAVEELNRGGKVVVADLDHNGAGPTILRLLELGAREDYLRDPERFGYIEPEDRAELYAVVDHMAIWKPTYVLVDSIGELLPMFGASSNSADDFTDVHRQVIKPLVKTGACVVGIDHLAKGDTSKTFGSTGTTAKKRAIGGTSIRVKVDAAFTPGKGGSAYLSINKDRHGGLRKHCPTGDKEPLAGKFTLWQDGDKLRAVITAPNDGERNPEEGAPQADVDAIAALDPAPKTIAEAREALKWRNDRASRAFKAWKLSVA